MNEYQKIDSVYIKEIDSKVTLYRHLQSGARIVTYENDDTNKVFDISFRTPALNSTGLTHILEHSVLCGSKKYPVKDPFLFLVKSSLNTFLNAFTYPDRTCYPIASKNEKDFDNLMSVYCDAVFYPNVINDERLFRQEGWRYELFKKDDPLSINGVVYNEMKGDYSNPDEILSSSLMHNLFPDNCYHYESGGDPEVIPSLTYENFQAFYKKYYIPSNSYIFLYGKMDMEKKMEWLDREYLSKFTKSDFDTSIRLQKPFNKVKEVNVLYPINENEETEEKTTFAYAFAMKDSKDEKREMALRILNSQLASVPGAPLKKAFFEKKLGSAVYFSLEDDIEQPMNAFIVKNSDSSKREEIMKTYKETLTSLYKNGLNHKGILASLNQEEFRLREQRFSSSFPKGLGIILTSLSTMVYDDTFSGVTQGLYSLKIIAELKKDLENGYFEKVLKEDYLENTHALFLMMSPSKTLNKEKEEKLSKKLASYKASLSEEQINKLIEDSKALKLFQNTPDTSEHISTLPRLRKEDLDTKVEDWTDSIKEMDGAYEVYKQNLNTNGIVYNYYNFKASDLNEEELKYAHLLCMLYGRLNTEKYNENELSSEIMMNIGGTSFTLNLTSDSANRIKNFFSINYSALKEKEKVASSLIKEIVFHSDFSNEKIIRETVSRIRAGLEASLAESSHIYAVYEAGADKSLLVKEKNEYGGLPYYYFIKDLDTNFEKKKEEISANLLKISAKLLTKERFFSAYTGEEKDYKEVKKNTDDFYNHLGSGSEMEGPAFTSKTVKKAYLTPFDVSYVTRVGLTRTYTNREYGALLVLDNILSSDYLWMKVRVNNGAYGVYILNERQGLLSFFSYRDPKVKETDEVFLKTPLFIKEMNYTDDQLMEFKIGALAGLNPVVHVVTKGYNAFMHAYLNLTKEDIEERVKGIIEADLSTLKGFAGDFTEGLKNSSLVVIGKKSEIRKNQQMFKEIRNL